MTQNTSPFVQCLQKDPVFSKFDQRTLQDIESLAIRKIYKKGQYICLQDDIWQYALYIVSGKVGWVMFSPEGKRHIVFRMHNGHTIWGHSLFDQEPMPASLEVIEDCEVYLWTGDVILPVVSKNVAAVWEINRTLVSTMREVRDVVYGFAFHPVAGRLANLLLKHYQPIDGQAALRDLSLEEMAHSIGTTKEVVSKTLHQFDSAGMIEVSRIEITFTDREKLENIIHE